MFIFLLVFLHVPKIQIPVRFGWVLFRRLLSVNIRNTIWAVCLLDAFLYIQHSFSISTDTGPCSLSLYWLDHTVLSCPRGVNLSSSWRTFLHNQFTLRDPSTLIVERNVLDLEWKHTLIPIPLLLSRAEAARARMQSFQMACCLLEIKIVIFFSLFIYHYMFFFPGGSLGTSGR